MLDTIWRNASDGIPGNDDLGEMPSWAIFAAIGMYPKIPGRAELVLGSPLFARTEIHRKNEDVVITRSGAGPDSPYVREVRVDGRSTSKTWLPESFAARGGRVEFQMSEIPSKSWGVKTADAPPSFGSPE